jgi:hypothetical protein
MKKNLLLLTGISFFFFNCSTSNKGKIDTRFAIERNACKKLRDNVLVYAIFIDSKTTKSWTSFDIHTTLDSMKYAISWIDSQAKTNGVPVNMKFDYYKAKPIVKDLPGKSVYESLNGTAIDAGLSKLNKWADNISKKVAASIKDKPQTGKKEKGPKMSDTEKLVIKLKEQYQVENVILFYMLDNYYIDDLSATLNMYSDRPSEYAISSYKYPSLMALQILTLAGAASFRPDPLKKTEKNKELAQKEFPNDITVNGTKSLSELEIGEFTQFMIGWRSDIDNKYDKMFFTERIKRKKVKNSL